MWSEDVNSVSALYIDSRKGCVDGHKLYINLMKSHVNIIDVKRV